MLNLVETHDSLTNVMALQAEKRVNTIHSLSYKGEAVPVLN
jgi:hypothetical protein